MSAEKSKSAKKGEDHNKDLEMSEEKSEHKLSQTKLSKKRGSIGERGSDLDDSREDEKPMYVMGPYGVKRKELPQLEPELIEEKINRLKKKQSDEMRALIKKEESAEVIRNAKLMQDHDQIRKIARERDYGIERALASQRIIALGEKHEKEFARRVKELEKLRKRKERP